jgi:hypothetical protein
MNAVSTLGIDLAKNTFSVHGVDAEAAAASRLSPSVCRDRREERPCRLGLTRQSSSRRVARLEESNRTQEAQ